MRRIKNLVLVYGGQQLPASEQVEVCANEVVAEKDRPMIGGSQAEDGIDRRQFICAATSRQDLVGPRNGPVESRNASVECCNPAVGENNQPVAPRNCPVGSRKVPVAPRNCPVGSRKVPVEARKAPVAPRNYPVEARKATVGSRNRPVGARKAPVARCNDYEINNLRRFAPIAAVTGTGRPPDSLCQ